MKYVLDAYTYTVFPCKSYDVTIVSPPFCIYYISEGRPKLQYTNKGVTIHFVDHVLLTWNPLLSSRFFTIPQSHDLTAFHFAVNVFQLNVLSHSSHTIPLFKSYPMHCTFFFKPSQSLVFIKSTRKDGEAIWPEAIWAMCL